MFGQNLKKAVSKFIQIAQPTNDVKVTYLQTLVVCHFVMHSQGKHDILMSKTKKVGNSIR